MLDIDVDMLWAEVTGPAETPDDGELAAWAVTGGSERDGWSGYVPTDRLPFVSAIQYSPEQQVEFRDAMHAASMAVLKAILADAESGNAETGRDVLRSRLPGWSYGQVGEFDEEDISDQGFE